MTPHPDSCSCGDCIATRATEQVTRIRGRKTRRRRNPIWKDNERARRFWEACVIQELCRDDVPDTIQKADTALVAWRERWEVTIDDYAPPYPPETTYPPHRFILVTDNRYCGECGGGKLHPIHTS